MKKNFTPRKRQMILSFTFIFTLLLISCGDDEGPTLATDVNLASFEIQGLDREFTIDNGTKTITNENPLPFGTDLTNMVAVFQIPDGASAEVNGTEQVSGSTALDFSDPVVYDIIAEDGVTMQSYTVTITVNTSAWTELTADGEFAKFNYFNAVHTNGKFYIGGLLQPEGGDFFSLLYSSEDGETWEEVATTPDTIITAYAGMTEFNDKIFLLGGYIPTVFIPDPFVYLPGSASYKVMSTSDGKNWSEVTDTTKAAPVAAPNLFNFNNNLWIVGGNGIGFGTIQAASKTDVYKSSDGASWEKLNEEDAFPPRSYPGTAVFNDKMWVFGGSLRQFATTDPTQYIGDTYSSTDGITWTEESADAFPARAGAAVFQYKGKLYMIGGYSANEAEEVVYYKDMWVSEDGISWIEADNFSLPEGFSARAHHQIIINNDKIYIIGGTSADGNFNDVWVGEFVNE